MQIMCRNHKNYHTHSREQLYVCMTWLRCERRFKIWSQHIHDSRKGGAFPRLTTTLSKLTLDNIKAITKLKGMNLGTSTSNTLSPAGLNNSRHLRIQVTWNVKPLPPKADSCYNLQNQIHYSTFYAMYDIKKQTVQYSWGSTDGPLIYLSKIKLVAETRMYDITGKQFQQSWWPRNQPLGVTRGSETRE